MVQIFYYENRGKNFKKLLNYEGVPFRINLYPSEEVGSTLTTYWIVRIPWWTHTKAQIVEVCGTRYRYATAKLMDLGGGSIVLKGQYKNTDHKNKFRQLLEFVQSSRRDAADGSNNAGKSNSLKSMTSGREELKYFQMVLSTNVTNEDFQQGYSMTGRLEQHTQSPPLLSPSVSPLGAHPSSSATSFGDRPANNTQSIKPMCVTHFAGVKRKGY